MAIPIWIALIERKGLLITKKRIDVGREMELKKLEGVIER